LFVSLCKLHQQQKSVTNHCKKPITNARKENQFPAHVEVALIDLCNLFCECQSRQKWVLHVGDHFSKYSWMFALKNKQTEAVAAAPTNLFWMFGFPSILLLDKQVHGALRPPSTQGLVERNNRPVKRTS